MLVRATHAGLSRESTTPLFCKNRSQNVPQQVRAGLGFYIPPVVCSWSSVFGPAEPFFSKNRDGCELLLNFFANS